MPGRFLMFFSRKLLPVFLFIFIILGVLIFNSIVYSADKQTVISIEDSPAMVSVNHVTNRAVITHGHSNTDLISIVDLNTEKVISEIPVAKLPSGVAIDTTENVAVITHENERLLTFIDLNANHIIAALDIDTKPKNIAVNSKTHIAAVTSAIDTDVFFIDISTRTVVAQTDVGIKSGDVAVDPERNIAFVLNKNKSYINIIDMSNYTLSDSIALDKKPQAIDINPETNTAVTTNYHDGSITIVDLSTKRLVTKALGAFPLDVVINTIDDRAAILCDKNKTLLLLDLKTNEIIRTYSLPRHPRSVAVNSIRNTAIIADDETDSLTIISLPLSPTLPKVQIFSPVDNAQIYSKAVPVSGTVENSTDVMVNDLSASVNGGTFLADLILGSGQNTIAAIATDKYGRTACHDILVDILVGKITGTVTNAFTGWLLPSSIVSITDSKGYNQTINTNADGSFNAELAAGPFSGAVEKPWYLPYAFNGSVIVGGTSTLDISLTPVPPLIGNIRVTDITESSAKINWTTDQITGGSVEYGKTTAYGGIAPDSIENTFHSITLSNLSPATTYHFRVNAISANGSSAVSNDVTFKTKGNIEITINAPADGITINNNSVIVTGSITNPANVETGITVNGMPVSLNNNQFAVNNVPLNAGQTTITVTATDVNGTTVSKSMSVNATIPEKFIALSAYPESGVAPLEVSLKINGSFSIINPIITTAGPGAVEQLACDNPDEFKYKLTSEGIYYFTAQVTCPDGNLYQDTKAVTVLPLAQIDALLRAKWEAFSSALANKDISTALTMMHPVSSVRYQTMFNLLKDQLPAIVATHANLTLVSIINEERAWYDLRASESEGQFTYRVVFVKDTNGLWRILEF